MTEFKFNGAEAKRKFRLKQGSGQKKLGFGNMIWINNSLGSLEKRRGAKRRAQARREGKGQTGFGLEREYD